MSDLQQSLVNEIEPIVTGMGFQLVELKFGRSKNQQHMLVVIYRSEGVKLSDCTAVAKNLSPRLETLAGLEELRLQVSSPGLYRVFKDPREYRIFTDRGVTLIFKDGTRLGGIIAGATERELTLKQGRDMRKIEIGGIRKARLDYSQEVDG